MIIMAKDPSGYEHISPLNPGGVGYWYPDYLSWAVDVPF